MDLLAIARYYVDRMLTEVSGMKALLLDAETTQSISGVYSQTDIMNQEVYLVEKLEANKTDKLPHLKAVCFLRPTRENIARLRRELRDPRFGGYHLFFTNRAEDLRLQDLAELDTKEAVLSVQEYFTDFVALAGHHFAVPLARPHVVLEPCEWEYGASSEAIARMTDGLAALALSLRRHLSIRYQAGSEVAERLGASLRHLVEHEERELFGFGVRGGDGAPVLLLLDRRDDPVTPLLSQVRGEEEGRVWTYQAMLHEVLGIVGGCVDVPGVPGVKPEFARAWTYPAMLHEVLGIVGGCVDLRHVPGVKPEFARAVLSTAADPFFAKHAGSNFGEVGVAVKQLVDDLAGEQRAGRDLASIEAMSAFVENLGSLSHQQGVAYKHVTLMGELSAAVEARGLMAVSEVEQELACAGAALGAHAEAVRRAVGDPAHAPDDWLRLAALFALRYERDGGPQAAALAQQLREAGVPRERVALLGTLLARCGAKERVSDLFQDRTLSSRFAVLAKQHIKGVENVYTQHVPPLVGTLERLAKGKLSEAEYPAADRAAGAGPPPPPPRLIVAFVVGGTTYEEAAAVAGLNAAAAKGEGPLPPGTRVLLGGTGVQNSSSFLRDLAEELMAGSLAGITGKTCVAPLERAKILFQTGRLTSGSLAATLAAIYRHEGFSGLFRGNGASVLRIVPYSAIHFTAYEHYRRLLVEHTLPPKAPPARARLGIGAMLATTLRHEGLRGAYHGVGASMYGILPYAGLKFYVYQSLKQQYHHRAAGGSTAAGDGTAAGSTPNPGAAHPRLPVPVMLTFGGLAGLVAQTATYPFDVVRRRMQVEALQLESLHAGMTGRLSTGGLALRSTPQALLLIARVQGWRTLFVGLSINYLKVVPSTAIGFTVYDHMKHLLALPSNL
ncbi:Vacuolar protein sorting-associated protein 45-like protein [Auxenochlorella protothecoides]|uniref:Vacuolar protein sorting-associated protein 45-like protein n=1 Tax=Auxenochlorella protothecoides TaxID=3075 RepID=A0A087SFG2_AUXPR|nr:Vacuolar protein sorting-associated protein 45-like protein [Auxenochlorella protothecoides]KFM24466.1 Vacuolar protein sorting-associated protein 45-like protein [Auxenochlorella protothecoides]